MLSEFENLSHSDCQCRVAEDRQKSHPLVGSDENGLINETLVALILVKRSCGKSLAKTESMLIKEHRHCFYELAAAQNHVLILANGDVDGVCATAILLYLFRCDNVPFSVEEVKSQSHLQVCFRFVLIRRL